MTAIAFIDTETTSLRPDRRAWEVGLIVRKFRTVMGVPTGEWDDKEHHWFISARDLDLGNADLMSLNIGKFYDRHPDILLMDDGGKWNAEDAAHCRSELAALEDIERLTRGAHLVGAVVNFDADVLGARMRARGLCPSWHYHLIDVEALAVGALGGAPLPWKSDDLSKMAGVAVPEEDRHTALGDARWARAIYDAVVTYAPLAVAL